MNAMYTVDFIREHFLMYGLLWASGFTAGYAIRIVGHQVRESMRARDDNALSSRSDPLATRDLLR
jgi:hypothetical protein